MGLYKEAFITFYSGIDRETDLSMSLVVFPFFGPEVSVRIVIMIELKSVLPRVETAKEKFVLIPSFVSRHAYSGRAD